MLRKNVGLIASAGLGALLSLAQTDVALATAIAPTFVAAKGFAVLGGLTVSNVPFAGTVINGDVGAVPGLAVTGFPPGIVVPPGTIHAGDAAAQSAQSDVTAAIAAIGSGNQPCPGGNNFTGQDLGGKSLPPGVYCFSSSAQLTGALTLVGTSADVWVFQIGSTLTTAPGSSVDFTGGANACNVFWQTGTSATLGTTTSFNGNILSLTSITLNHGANIVSGRALAPNGSVTLDDNNVDATACSGVTPGGIEASAVFGPATIAAGGASTKTISLSNANASAAAIRSFTDSLPSGLVIATPSGASNTCGGALSAPTGGSVISMTGGAIPAASGGIPGVCTITVNVTAVIPGNYINTLAVGALVTTSGNNATASSATLRVGAATTAAVPTLTQSAIVALALLLALAAVTAMRRQGT
jgi:hypothetical protein